MCLWRDSANGGDKAEHGVLCETRYNGEWSMGFAGYKNTQNIITSETRYKIH